MHQLIEPLESYLRDKLSNYDDLSIDNIEQIAGGVSCETYRFQVNFSESGQSGNHYWILRRSPDGGIIETERRTEFKAYEAFVDTEVPVPRPIILEEDRSVLGRSFMIVEEIRDCEALIQMLTADPYVKFKEKLGKQKWQILGKIASADPTEMWSVEELANHHAEECWKVQLSYWQKQILNADPHPDPLVLAIIRWLYRNPPPPPERIGVVHGDYRSGNFLFNTDGDIKGILDWEMCHPGDPLEDIGWAMTSVWSLGGKLPPGRLIEKTAAIEFWQQTSGRVVDKTALRWWEIFACIKGLGIWLTSGREAEKTGKRDVMLLGGCLWARDIHMIELASIGRKLLAEGAL